MASYSSVFYASSIAQTGTGNAWTLAVAATLAEALQTTGDTKLASCESIGSTATTKILECTTWLQASDDAAMSSVISGAATIDSVVFTARMFGVRGSVGDDDVTLAASALRWYNAASQTYSTASTPRGPSSDYGIPSGIPETIADDMTVSTWTNGTPTTTLIRAAQCTCGFRFNLIGDAISSSVTIDRVTATVAWSVDEGGGSGGAGTGGFRSRPGRTRGNR